MNKPIYIDSLPLIFPSGLEGFHKTQELGALILETHVVMMTTTFWSPASKGAEAWDFWFVVNWYVMDL